MPQPISSPQAVLDFWFSLKNPNKKDDRRVREALEHAHRLATEGQLDDWGEEPRSRLALILLLDQIPRHLFRDRPQSYATDQKARGLTALFMEREDWQGFSPLEKLYSITPWLHAEEVEKQRRINPLYRELAPLLPGLEFMGRISDLYLETIALFGRFPHRNAILGRQTTPEEEKFLKEQWGPRRRRDPPGEKGK